MQIGISPVGKLSPSRVKTLTAITRIALSARSQGKKVVTTNGCFDLLHLGHVRYLEHAKSLGDILIVGVNSDRSVRRNKGPLRPIVPQGERAKLLAALKPVDFVFIFDEETPIRWLQKIKPHIHIKGGDYKTAKIIEKEVVEKNGGRFVLGPMVKYKSTTELIRKIARLIKKQGGGVLGQKLRQKTGAIEKLYG